eukprot:gene24976-biopygen17962
MVHTPQARTSSGGSSLQGDWGRAGSAAPHPPVRPVGACWSLLARLGPAAESCSGAGPLTMHLCADRGPRWSRLFQRIPVGLSSMDKKARSVRMDELSGSDFRAWVSVYPLRLTALQRGPRRLSARHARLVEQDLRFATRGHPSISSDTTPAICIAPIHGCRGAPLREEEQSADTQALGVWAALMAAQSRPRRSPRHASCIVRDAPIHPIRG